MLVAEDVRVVLGTLRDVLSHVATIADRLTDPDADAAVLRRRVEALADRVGRLAEGFAGEAADRYNAAWDAEDRQARRGRSTVAQAAQETAQAALVQYYAARAALVGTPVCASHDWVAAPRDVAAVRVCRRCPQESREDV